MGIGKRSAQLAILLFLGAGVCFSASAQGRLALQAHGGGTLPLSAYTHNGIRTTGLTDELEPEFIPRLVNQYPGLGFNLGLSILIDAFEVRYLFSFLRWDWERTLCTGTSDAREITGTSQIDDSTVSYDCSDPTSSDISAEAREPLKVHVISLGYRIYWLELLERFDPYVVVSGGAGFARHVETHLDNRHLTGFSVRAFLGAGVGAEVPIGDLISVSIEGRYAVLLSGPESGTQSAANRSFERGEPAGHAVIDAFHAFTFDLGVQVNFR